MSLRDEFFQWTELFTVRRYQCMGFILTKSIHHTDFQASENMVQTYIQYSTINMAKLLSTD